MKNRLTTLIIGLCGLVFSTSVAEARVLKEKNRGKDVIVFKADLKEIGIPENSLTPNDKFDNKLGDAVERLQLVHGLKPDRIVGKKTKALVQKLKAKKSKTVEKNQPSQQPVAPQKERREKVEEKGTIAKLAKKAVSILTTNPFSSFQGINGIPTYYYVHQAYPGKGRVRDARGNVLGQVRLKDLQAGLMEGTMRLPNGRTVNVHKVYTRRGQGRWCWKYSNKWGEGVNGDPLIPFKDIAVPKRYVGKKFFIPATEGMDTPFGRQNGWWTGKDIGGRITQQRRGIRIDFFVGKPEYAGYLSRAGIRHMGALAMYMR